MKKEQVWWMNEKYVEFDGGRELATVYKIPAIVAEATRRGIEQGKREAWEEAISFSEENLKGTYEKFKELPMPALAELKKTEYAHGYRQGWEMAISAFMSYALPVSIRSLDEKLSSLSQSSNEKV